MRDTRNDLFFHTARGLAIALICAVAPANAVNPEEGVRLTLEPSWTEINRFEPLVCRVTLENKSSKPLKLEKYFGAEYGAFRFEARPPTSDSFQRAPAVSQGLSDGFGVVRADLDPGGTYASLELLWPSTRRPYFDEAGIWELRVVLTGEPQKGFASETVRISVKQTSDSVTEQTKELSTLFRQSALPAQTASLVALHDSLQPGRLQNVLDWHIGEVMIREARSEEEIAAARRTCDRLLRRAEEVSREFLAIRFARQCIVVKRWDLAGEFATRVPQNCHERLRLLTVIQENASPKILTAP